MIKANNGLSIQQGSENVHFAENLYNCRHSSRTRFKVNTEKYGKYSASHLGQKICNSIQ